ncbi:MAG TPA: DUF6457 domain-containing protein [Propionibacteriaceae bacterium]|nr:DUF6457 domain-containing protein [Propionibacteriaceae bacterium]
MQLDDWLAAVSAEIGTDDFLFDNDAIHTLLDLARDSAHEIERVAAPLTTFLVGIAVGRGEPLGGVAARATALAMRQAPATDPETPPTAG